MKTYKSKSVERRKKLMKFVYFPCFAASVAYIGSMLKNRERKENTIQCDTYSA